MPRFILIGNPENRRVGLFQQALERRALAAGSALASSVANVIPWLVLTREGEPERIFGQLPEEPALVRIDSFGENFDVERALLVRGYEDAVRLGAWAAPPLEASSLTFDRGLIYAPRQQHCGFLRVLGEIERALAKRPWLHVLNAPESLERLFDKRTCALTFARAGVPIPRPLPDVRSAAELRAQMEETNTPRVFVKLSCGSSASCLALYEYLPARPRDAWLFTSMEIEGPRLYNSLRPRRYHDPAAIDRLLGFLFREGSHVEELVPKARYGGRFFDTRMLVVEGDVAFTVVRRSQHPITNLHLGGVRGTNAELEAAVPADVLEDARASCRKVFAAHDCLHVGVDVMFTAALDGHRILEANAFGDLLPNLQRDGLDVYEWEIEQALRRRA